MLYVLSASLNNNKKVSKELTQVFGIGYFQAELLCNSLNIGNDCFIMELTQTLVYKLLLQIEHTNLIVDSELQKQKTKFIAYLINAKTFRGSRHILKLPVRGQRTRTNARTARKAFGLKKEK
jgi:small subunit ribosomal protein S13